jgi:enoyl-[acyl-carrier protein] reductase II
MRMRRGFYMKELDRLMKRGNNFLGTRVPVMCGAMTWISDVDLVKAVNKAGAFGILAGGNLPPELLEGSIDSLKKTEKSFGLNLITIAPNYGEHLEIACKKEVPYIIFAGSFPKASEVSAAKTSGAKVLCFASTVQIAKRMRDYGADGIILEGSEAGGHIGPIATSVLIQQFLFDEKEKPIFIAGGIATGRMVLHLLLMGASGVQMGTRFVMSEECSAHENFKNVFTQSGAKDAVATPQFNSALPVIPVRALRNKGMKEFGDLQLRLLRELEEGKIERMGAQYEVEKYWVGSLRKAVKEGDVAYGSLMAGQSVGLVKEIKPVREIIAEIQREMEDELARVRDFFLEQRDIG